MGNEIVSSSGYSHRRGDSDRGCPYLSADQVDEIAEKAAEKAVVKMTNRLYRQVGKSVVEKFLAVIGIIVIALYVWMSGKG